VRAPVDVITQEQIVNVGDVARRAGRAVLLKQAHEIAKLAMQVAKDLDGGWKASVVEGERGNVERVW